MFKKLLIAVFILGLILTFGNANADYRLQEDVKPYDQDKIRIDLTEKISQDEFRIKQPGYTAPDQIPVFDLTPIDHRVDISLEDESPTIVKSGCFEQDWTGVNTSTYYGLYFPDWNCI